MTSKEKYLQKFKDELDNIRRNWNTGNQLSDLTNQGINIGHDEAYKIAEKIISQALEAQRLETYSEINDGIFDETSYSPIKGKPDKWWYGVEHVEGIVSKRLDQVKGKAQ